MNLEKLRDRLAITGSDHVAKFFGLTMGELFRSREIDLIQIYIQLDAVHDTLEELGELGLVQFRDVRKLAIEFIF